MNFERHPKFQKEFNRLARKYKSLPEDLLEFCNVLSALPFGTRKHFVVLTQKRNINIVKARFFCRYLKGSSLRIIYAYFDCEKKIEFIELYSKGEKEAENSGRIKEYLNSFKQH